MRRAGRQPPPGPSLTDQVAEFYPSINYDWNDIFRFRPDVFEDLYDVIMGYRSLDSVGHERQVWRDEGMIPIPKVHPIAQPHSRAEDAA
jgi:hypothetical protein